MSIACRKIKDDENVLTKVFETNFFLLDESVKSIFMSIFSSNRVIISLSHMVGTSFICIVYNFWDIEVCSIYL